MNYLPTCTSILVVQHPCQVSFKSMQRYRRSWEDKLRCIKILIVKDHNSAKIFRTWIISPQHLCQVSFKSMQRYRSWGDKLKCVKILSVKGHYTAKILRTSMQWCRRSWEDKLKFVKILSVKGHSSAKICGTWIISPHALLDLWCNIPAKLHTHTCKDIGGVQKTS